MEEMESVTLVQDELKFIIKEVHEFYHDCNGTKMVSEWLQERLQIKSKDSNIYIYLALDDK